MSENTKFAPPIFILRVLSFPRSRDTVGLRTYMASVLILTAGYGEGHNSAARGLHAACANLGLSSEILDVGAETGGASYSLSRRAYQEIINRTPWAWSLFYRAVDRVPLDRWALKCMPRMAEVVGRHLAEKKPQLVLSVFPVYALVMQHLYGNGPRPFAFHTVVTDSISINGAWYRAPSDSYIVANEETAQILARAGVEKSLIRPLGFPVSPLFALERPARVQPIHPRILYMVNASPTEAPAIIKALLEIPNVEITVTAGRDEAFQKALKAQTEGKPVTVLGWTDRMPELLMTHHLLIGKAGGATVQETIAAGTPMLITQAVPGQEEGNAQLLFAHNCAALCRKPAAIAAKTRELFADNAALWQTWMGNISQISRPDAAREIVRSTMASLPSQGSSSPSSQS